MQEIFLTSWKNLDFFFFFFFFFVKPYVDAHYSLANHTLPTGGTGRYTGGLSVFNFLRIRTWMRVDDPSANACVVEDSIVMARLEGLEGHARAAEALVEAHA